MGVHSSQKTQLRTVTALFVLVCLVLVTLLPYPVHETLYLNEHTTRPRHSPRPRSDWDVWLSAPKRPRARGAAFLVPGRTAGLLLCRSLSLKMIQPLSLNPT